MDFNVGDSVRLKGGGVTMTVEKIESDDVTCVWHRNRSLMRETFAAVALQKVSYPAPIW